MVSRLWPLLLLAGCWLSEDEVAGVVSGEADADTDADADADTDADTDADVDVVVESVEPPYGPSGGGTDVVVTATGVDGDVEVWFGDAEATVVGIDDDAITVTTPAGIEGYADVTVKSHGKEDVLTGAFHYWEDGDGLVGAIGEYNWYTYQGGYWDGSDYGEAFVWFVKPADVRYEDFWGGSLVDKCTRSPSLGTLEYYDAGASLTLVSDLGASIPLSFQSAGEFGADLTSSSQWVASSSYALEMPGAAPWPELAVDDFVLTPNTVAITDPYVDGATTAEIDYVTQSFPLAWSGPYDGDYAVALLIRYSGSTPVDYVYCHLNDDGAFTVPSSVWSSWTTLEQLTIVVGRVRLTTATLPHNGADIEVAGVHYAVGAVWTL